MFACKHACIAGKGKREEGKKKDRLEERKAFEKEKAFKSILLFIFQLKACTPLSLSSLLYILNVIFTFYKMRIG